MTMDSTLATLACYLLALSFAVAQTQTDNVTITPGSHLNPSHTTTTVSSSSSTVHVPVISNSTENTTPFTDTTRNNETFTETTAATNESHFQTSQSTTIMTPLTNSTSPMTTTPGTPTFTTLTTPTLQTTGGNTSTPDTTAITTSSHTVNTSTDSMDRTTQGLGLNTSERNMTIVFSAVLGVFALALAVFAFHRCKHKIQYLHQPLNDAGETGEFVADDDTLVISGGLYDGHPIYDNVPTVPADQSQFRLQFLH